MEYRNLGRSGLRVSAVGLGCNNFGLKLDREATRAVVHKALDLGVTLFDTANSYGNRGGSETHLGEILGARRKDMVLATKFGLEMDDVGVKRGGSRRYIMLAVEESLHRLKTDWIDLYQLHKPDPLTPMEETLGALSDLVRQGKVRYIGCSNVTAWQVADAHWLARTGGLASFVSCQDEYNMLNRQLERDLMPAMQRYGLGLLPYFPLANGLLTGKYKRNAPMPAGARLTLNLRYANRDYVNDTNWPIVEKLVDFASARGRSLLELAFAWTAARPTVASVIAGATTPEQIEANCKAIGWSLSAAEIAEAETITQKS